MKKLFSSYIFLFFLLTPMVFSQQPSAVRLKDIGKIVEARDNQIMGFGLVVGLRNTGILDLLVSHI